jgi:20S proteasome subunit alpha 7
LTKTHEEGSENKKFELELSWICDKSQNRHQNVPKEIAREAEKKALAAIEAEEMGDD